MREIFFKRSPEQWDALRNDFNIQNFHVIFPCLLENYQDSFLRKLLWQMNKNCFYWWNLNKGLKVTLDWTSDNYHPLLSPQYLLALVHRKTYFSLHVFKWQKMECQSRYFLCIHEEKCQICVITFTLKQIIPMRKKLSALTDNKNYFLFSRI